MGCCFNGSTPQRELAASISFNETRNTTIMEKKPMGDWHRGQVLEWLDSNNNTDLQQLKPVFHQHQISGLTLETITKDQLRNELNINQEALCDLFLVEREKYIKTKINQKKQIRNSESQSISKSVDIKIKPPVTQISQTIINITNLYNMLNQFNMNSIKTKIIDLRDNNLFNKQHILTSVNININLNNANNEINTFEDLTIIDTNDKVEFYKHLQSFKAATKLIVIFDESNTKNKIFKTNLQNFLYKIYGIHQYILLESAFTNFYDKYPFLCHCGDEREEKIDRRYPTEVIDNKLYIGDWKQSESFAILSNLNITHILNVCGDKHQVTKINVFYKHMPFKDNMEENILDGKLENAIKWIDDCLYDDNRILVHCMEGISRSATIIIGYLMNKNKWSFNIAWRYLKNIRPEICPNDGFKKQLVQFQKQIIP